MRTSVRELAALVLATSLGTGPVAAAQNAPVGSAFAGHWTGCTRFMNTFFTHQPLVAVELDVLPDGAATARVGDARTPTVHVIRNRGTLGRSLHVGTDFRIEGPLEGPISAADGVTRKRGMLLFNAPADPDTIYGGFASPGTPTGGRTGAGIASKMLLVRNAPTPMDLATCAAALRQRS